MLAHILLRWSSGTRMHTGGLLWQSKSCGTVWGRAGKLSVYRMGALTYCFLADGVKGGFWLNCKHMHKHKDSTGSKLTFDSVYAS